MKKIVSLAKQYFSIPTAVVIWLMLNSTLPAASFKGQFFSGEGDTAYIKLLDISRRMFEPDYEFQNISMLYTPWWNGFVEGPTWDAAGRRLLWTSIDDGDIHALSVDTGERRKLIT